MNKPEPGTTPPDGEPNDGARHATSVGNMASRGRELDNMLTILLSGIERARSEQDAERRQRHLDHAEWAARQIARIGQALP